MSGYFHATIGMKTTEIQLPIGMCDCPLCRAIFMQRKHHRRKKPWRKRDCPLCRAIFMQLFAGLMLAGALMVAPMGDCPLCRAIFMQPTVFMLFCNDHYNSHFQNKRIIKKKSFDLFLLSHPRHRHFIMFARH